MLLARSVRERRGTLIVKIADHRMAARFDAQDKLHLAPQDKVAALRAAKTLAPLACFDQSAGAPRSLIEMSMGHVCSDSCPFKYLKMVYFGPTSSGDDAAIIHRRQYRYAR